MKALLTFLIVALISVSVSANPRSKGDYLVTNDGKVLVAKVQFGLLKFNAKNENGEKIKVDYENVVSFKKNGETYTKMPLYNGKVSTKLVFMKLVSWRNGLGLYCYDDPLLRKGENKRYFVFKGENIFWLEVDSRNVETIRNFFSRK